MSNFLASVGACNLNYTSMLWSVFWSSPLTRYLLSIDRRLTFKWIFIYLRKLSLNIRIQVENKFSFSVLRCPLLAPPANGYFVTGRCTNVYGGLCRWQCYKGYKQKGSGVKYCEKIPGRNLVRWSGGLALCEGKISLLSEYLENREQLN